LNSRLKPRPHTSHGYTWSAVPDRGRRVARRPVWLLDSTTMVAGRPSARVRRRQPDATNHRSRCIVSADDGTRTLVSAPAVASVIMASAPSVGDGTCAEPKAPAMESAKAAMASASADPAAGGHLGVAAAVGVIATMLSLPPPPMM